MQLYELFAADRRVGDGVVMIDNIVETYLVEIIVQPFADEGLHVAQFL